MPLSNVQTNKVATLLAKEDITDPTDFPGESIAPGLRQIDSALRCKICKEIIEAPVTLQCGHCFCSLCIRGALADKQECPSCRKIANEFHLRTNPLVEEIVVSWMEARALILRLSKDEERRVTRASSKVNGPSSPTKLGLSAKKRKLSRDSSPGSVLDTPSRAEPSRLRRAQIDDDPMTPKPRKSPFEADPLEEFEIMTTSDSRDEELPGVSDDGLVECPMCGRHVLFETINNHIDANCPSPSTSHVETPGNQRSKKAEWSNIFSGTTNSEKRKGKERQLSPVGPDPLPKASYGVLKDKQLKSMLAEHKLPTSGDRSTLIARHQRWVIIYNGNLDRSEKHRKTVEDLRQELKRWERDKKGKKTGINDVVAYQKANRTEFAQLVEAARPKKSQKENEPSQDGEGAKHSGPNSGPVVHDEVMVIVEQDKSN